MKKLMVLILMTLMIPNVFAAEVEPQGTPLRKLQRGFLNVALSPLEIAHSLAEVKKKDSMPPSWAFGLIRGASAAAGRALVGVYEMVSFGSPTPSNYEPIVMPEFTWEYMNAPETENKPAGKSQAS